MSYSSEVEAEAYFDSLYGKDLWSAISSADKVKALTRATQIIDRLNFAGGVTVEGQANEFPRDGDTVVPDDIKKANSEIAYALVDDVDPDVEYENLKMISQGYANVRSTYDRQQEAQPHVLAGVPSVSAWQYLMPYLKDPRTINLNRV